MNEAALIQAMVGKGHSESTARATITGRSGDSLQNLYREYLGGQPQTAEQVTPYLSNYQDTLLAVPTPEEIREEVTPTTPLPEPISRVEEFEKLRTQYGVPEMETYLNDLKTQEEFLYSEMRARTGAERGKPVPMGVISGRVSEIERQQMERIDVVTRLKNSVTNQLNTAYAVISTYVSYLGMDYQDAVDSYNDAFQRNISIYGLISEARQEAKEDIKYVEGVAREERRFQQQVASANLQTMMNAITSGNVSYSDLPSDQKLLVSRLEAEAGLPVGFTSSLRINPQDTVLFQSTSKGVTQVGFMNTDGSVRVEKYGTPTDNGNGNGKLTDADYKDYLIQDIEGYSNLDSVMKFYGQYLDPNEILRLYDLRSPFDVHKESDDELARKYGVSF